MTDVDPRDDDYRWQDTAISAGLDRLVHVLDAPPADLVERVQFAIALENLDVEVARWERAGSFAGVRGDRPGTVTFTVDHLTVMVSFTPTGGRHRIDGWLVPPGQHTVEVRVSDHDSTTTQADDGGRFVLADVPAGTTQILVHLESVHGEPSRTIVTPTLML